MNHQTVSFSKETNVEFYKTLRSRVNSYFKDNNITRHANAAMVIKTIVMLAIYLVPFGFLFFQVPISHSAFFMSFICFVVQAQRTAKPTTAIKNFVPIFIILPD